MHSFYEKKLLGFFIIEKRSASQSVHFVRSKRSFTLYLSALYLSLVPYRSTDSQTRSFL
jgi:hypothetical protein